jgi:hypothetical protein
MVKSYDLFDAPGVWTRCDRPAACLPYLDRPQFSLDFLCCEDFNWVWAHVVNPAFIYLMSGSFYFAWLAAFLFECAEAIVVTVYKGFPIGQSTESDMETVDGLLLGDAFINALLGVIIAKQICTLTGFVAPFSRWHSMVNGWMRYKYCVLFVLIECGFLFVTLGATFSDPTTLIAAFFIGISLVTVYRWTTNFPEDVYYVWQGRAGVVARDRTFWLYASVCVLLASQNAGLEYLANDWYQVWLMAAIIIIALIIANAVKSSKSK